MPTAYEGVMAFIARHGGAASGVLVGGDKGPGIIVYEDGSWRDSNPNPMVCRTMDCENMQPYDREKLRFRRAETIYNRLKRDFVVRKAGLQSLADAYAAGTALLPPDDASIAHLKELNKKVKAANKYLKEVKAALVEVTPSNHNSARYAAQRHETAQECLNRIKAID
jgi:hypothetical protein